MSWAEGLGLSGAQATGGENQPTGKRGPRNSRKTAGRGHIPHWKEKELTWIEAQEVPSLALLLDHPS